MVDDVRTTIESVFRREYGLVVAALNRHLRDLELTEDVVQEAMERALVVWPERGIPDRPAAWITTTARRRAIDRLRRARTLDAKTEQLAYLAQVDGDRAPNEVHEIPDERLRLIFTCCHPALSMEARVALTLKTVSGLSVPEIARAFLVEDAAMYQRLVRAKRRVRDLGLPYEVPAGPELLDRLPAVLGVLYLVFNEGYLPGSGAEATREELASEGIRLARLLASLMPDEPEVQGLLALMLLHHSRRRARLDPAGALVPMEEQDRSVWDRDMAREGADILDGALRRRQSGPYQVQAAISALHHEATSVEDTDWMQIAALYGELGRRTPGPLVALNHAVAVAMWRGPEAGLSLLEGLEPTLDGYHLFHAARADLLRRLGRRSEAEMAYLRALEIAGNPAERHFLEGRLSEVTS